MVKIQLALRLSHHRTGTGKLPLLKVPMQLKCCPIRSKP